MGDDRPHGVSRIFNRDFLDTPTPSFFYFRIEHFQVSRLESP